MKVRWQDYIEERKEVMMGKPVFKGTRLTVEHILNEMAAGMTKEEILAGYPRITSEHLQAALLYCSAVLSANETIYA